MSVISMLTYRYDIIFKYIKIINVQSINNQYEYVNLYML